VFGQADHIDLTDAVVDLSQPSSVLPTTVDTLRESNAAEYDISWNALFPISAL
jgi:hypothetical protein